MAGRYAGSAASTTCPSAASSATLISSAVRSRCRCAAGEVTSWKGKVTGMIMTTSAGRRSPINPTTASGTSAVIVEGTRKSSSTAAPSGQSSGSR